MTEPTGNPVPGQRRVFKRLTVDAHFSPIVNGAILVSWALEKSFIEPGPYTFVLYRGGAPSENPADWQEVSTTVDQPWLYDRSPRRPQKGLGYFYRVELIDGNGTHHYSQAADAANFWGRYDWTLAREIIRKETLVLRKRAGVRGLLFKRRTFGDRCPCTDPETGEINSPDCASCYGTGFVGGYHAPFEYWLIMNPTQQVTKLTPDQGLLVANRETVRALAYPKPDPNDFWLLMATDQRFIVGGNVAAIARHRGIDLILQLELTERARSESIYQVPVPCVYNK